MFDENDDSRPPPPANDEEARVRLGELGREALESLRDRRPNLYSKLQAKGELFLTAWRCERRAGETLGRLVENGVPPHEAYECINDCLDILPGYESDPFADEPMVPIGIEPRSPTIRNSGGFSVKLALKLVAQFHFCGAALAFTYFSYLYSKTHGFLDWFYLGAIVPGLKALVWEAFFISAILARYNPNPVEPQLVPNIVRSSPTANLTADATAVAQLTLWNSEGYKQLVAIAERQGPLDASYRTGDGSEEVKLQLAVNKEKAVLLSLDLPKQSIPGSSTRVPIVIRDQNGDGEPDSFQIKLDGSPLEGDSITSDGFVVYSPSRKHELIRYLWSFSIGVMIQQHASSP
jgi:hypothetical protein